MSYEKVKSIKIDEKQGKVFINCVSNNVRPLDYTRQEYSYFSKILNEQGRAETEIALLKEYESGNLQEGKNKYTNALLVLRYVFGEEYNKFNWRNNYKFNSEEDKKVGELRESNEFKELLRKALNYKIGKERYIISQDYYFGKGEENKVYAKCCLTCIKWRNKNKATKFLFEEQARNYLKNFSNSENWKIEKL